MSDHPVTVEDDCITGIAGLREAVTRAIRAPDQVALSGLSAIYHFNVDLTAAEVQQFADVLAAVRSRVGLPVDEYATIKPDIQTLITYQGIATPTLAQTVTATKAQSRILRAILRS